MSSSQPSLHKISVIGAGAWGTALAMQFARCGSNVRLTGVVERFASEEGVHAGSSLWDVEVEGALPD